MISDADIYIYIYILYQHIGLVGRVFANGQGDRSSIQGQIRPMNQKIILDATLLNTLHYKVHYKVVEQSRERSFTLPYTLV